MVTLRCTRKLLKRLPVATDPNVPSTTMLGDWYCEVLLTRAHHLVVCMSETSLLCTVVLYNDFRRDPRIIALTLAHLLLRNGFPEERVKKEVGEMSEVRFAPTVSRSVRGCPNDAVHGP
jgi:hypothetical protein